MLSIRKSNERGSFKNSWLDARQRFSFAEYYDPKQMGVSVLRVLNEDVIGPGGGFPNHPHNNMEIISYVLQGELEHKDSMGNGSTIRAGDVQRLSAGTGIVHSEFNPSATNNTRLLQIWLLPNRHNVEPSYEQKFFSTKEKQGRLALLVSEDGRNESIKANVDALIYTTLLDKEQVVSYPLSSDRIAYLQVATGSVKINGKLLNVGDSATIYAEAIIELIGKDNAGVLLFDMPLNKKIEEENNA
jgi:hypothetical protein